MPKARLDLRFDPELLASIDAVRGTITRTAYVEQACFVAVLKDQRQLGGLPPVDPPRPCEPTMDLLTKRGRPTITTEPIYLPDEQSVRAAQETRRVADLARIRAAADAARKAQADRPKPGSLIKPKHLP